MAALFSPHRGEQLLAWLAALAGTAQAGLFMTLPFGMNKDFQAIYSQPDQVLRFALLDREGNGTGLVAAQAALTLIRQRANVVLAVGNYIKASALDRWVAEIDKITQRVNVHWVHTKYLLVDPLGLSPVVVVGSANFSSASTNANDENLLVIRGDERVADVYLTEFMRLHVHYTFREALAKWAGKGKNVATWKPQFLVPDDSWQADYFAVGAARYQRRCYFSK